MSRQIVDGFTFYNEEDLLLYRLQLLSDVVDWFVLVEATHTHVGKPKPLWFAELKQQPRFAPFVNKIVHVVVDDFPFPEEHLDVAQNHQWANEQFQRNCIVRGLTQLALNLDDIVIISDVDEIPRPAVLRALKSGTLQLNQPHCLEMQLYYYNLRCVAPERDAWRHPKCCTVQQLGQWPTCDALRRSHEVGCPGIPHAGWHLSYFGDPAFIRNKLQNFAHQEMNRPDICDLTGIAERVAAGHNLFLGPDHFLVTPLTENPDLPEQWDTWLTRFV